MAKSTGETIWWSLFAAGGVVAALFVPAFIFITGIAVPFVESGAIENIRPRGYPALFALTFSVWGRLVLFLVISLPLFHCAHRIVHTSKDLGIQNAGAHSVIAFLCYGGAFVGTGIAVFVLWL